LAFLQVPFFLAFVPLASAQLAVVRIVPHPDAHYPDAHYPDAHYPDAHYPDASEDPKSAPTSASLRQTRQNEAPATRHKCGAAERLPTSEK
jgi:hypothetical protein